MALKLRLRRQGRRNAECYRIVVTDVRNKRDGKYVEAVGGYNPLDKDEERTLFLDHERLRHWLSLGVQPTDKVLALIARAAPDIYRARQDQILEHKKKAAVKRKAK